MNERPRFPIRFLRWFCRPDYVEEFEGDILELFEKRSAKQDVNSTIRLWWDVIRTLRWSNLQHPFRTKNYGIMIRNYFKVGYRNLIRDYKFSLLNLFGLSIGLCFFILMMVVIRQEYSFDAFHSKADRIFQVIQVFRQADGADPEIWTPLPLAEALRESVPGVENSLFMYGSSSNWVEVGGKRFFEEDGIIADRSFFDFFDFQLVEGDADQALAGKRSTVISQSLREKYFGDGAALGQQIQHDFYGVFTVTGVMEDVPANSYFQFDFVLSPDYESYFEHTASWYEPWFKSWEGHPVSTFVLLRDPSEADLVGRAIVEVGKQHLAPDQVNEHFLLGLKDLHFGSNHIDGRVNQHIKGNQQQVQLFALVAMLILLMACFNYINLATARSIRRNREVGVRKSIGAHNNQIRLQFLTESFVLVFISTLVAFAMAWLVAPYIQRLIDVRLIFSWELIVWISPWLILGIVLVTLLAGFYPAAILSRYSAIMAMRTNKTSGKGTLLRNGLTVIQLALAIVFSVGLLIVDSQYKFLSDKSLGFDTDQLLVVEINSGGVRRNFELLKEELLREPSISGITGISRMIGGYRSPLAIKVANDTDPESPLSMKFYGMDQDALSVLGLELLAGRNFQGVRGIDSASVIINEEAMSQLDAKVGEWIMLESDDGGHGDQLRAQVIGVVKDFHFESLHTPIKPVVLGYLDNVLIGLDDIVFKIDSHQMTATLETIERVHNRFDTNDVMTWEFLDDMSQRAYEDELRFRNLFQGVSVVSVLLVLLGLVGLMSYNIYDRLKEFGIRKVFGASYFNLISLQSGRFVKALGLSALVSVPVAWQVSDQWLRSFAYRIDMSVLPVLLVLIGLIAIIFTLLVLINQGIAARKPSDILRQE